MGRVRLRPSQVRVGVRSRSHQPALRLAVIQQIFMDMFQCTRQRQMHYRPPPDPIQRRERSPREVNMRMRDRYRPDGHQLRRPVERRPVFGAPETHEARAPPVNHSNAAMGSSHDVTAGVCSGAFGWLRGAPEHHLVSSPPAARGGTQCGAGARAPGTRRTEHR